MRVQDAIKALQDYNPEEEIMIQWFAKEHIDGNHNTTYDETHWNLAVRLFEKYDVGEDDFGVRTALTEAKERLQASSNL